MSLSRKKPSPPEPIVMDPSFEPCEVGAGEEYSPNGLFEFNVTRMLAHIEADPAKYPIRRFKLSELSHYAGVGDIPLDEDTILKADLTRPLLFVEIRPGMFSLIDGRHRLARARRENLKTLPSYLVDSPLHIPFLTSTFAYTRYVNYWNEKVALIEHAERYRFERQRRRA